jgi:putative ABC transport system permease protein
MFRNYFKTAWRHLLKNKFYSAINITGLAIGLAVGIMILLWVQDEMSYDRSSPNAGQIYRINAHAGTGATTQVWGVSPGPLTVYSRQSIPEVMGAVRIQKRQPILFAPGSKGIMEGNTAFVDPAYFSFFGVRLLEGDTAHPFNGTNSIVLAASTAHKYFGSEDPLGKTLPIDKEGFVVTGVMADFPGNSSTSYDVLFPMEYHARQFTLNGGNGNWKTIDEDLGDFQFTTYVRLRDDATVANVAEKFTQAYWQHRPGEEKTCHFTLQSLATLHLVAADGNTGALQVVRIFLLVAALILAIACINYVNLATARSMQRSREVSMRKIIGASRYQLFIQFILESTILFILASLLAFVMIWLLLPMYNSLAGKHLSFSLTNGGVWEVVGGATVATMVMASVYPALLLSSFKPIEALRGKLSMGLGNASFRKVLVVTQFVFSIGLIAGTVIIGLQLKYIRNKDLGMDKEQVLAFPMKGELNNHYAAAREEFLKVSGVLDVATSDNSIVGVGGTTGDTDWDGKPANSAFLIHQNGIDLHLIPLLKLQLAAGRNFTGTPADSANVILNETAIRETGIRDPIGKRFTFHSVPCTIIGVLKDFNYASLHDAIEPMIFKYEPAGNYLYVKSTGREMSAAIEAAGRIWKTYSPEAPFAYSFLDEDFDKLYQSEKRTGALFSAFAIVAVLISCLGLLGLATYTAQVRKKEIGVRKVLGAGVLRISYLLVRDFILLVGISFAIASPIVWYAMDKWLDNYAYRIQVPWWAFVGTGVTVMLVALLTVGYQAMRAAMMNPVKILRPEA